MTCAFTFPIPSVVYQSYICYHRGCGLELARFVFLDLMFWILYPNDTLTGFAKATKTVKQHWRPLNLKRSLPMLNWTSVSISNFFFLQNLCTKYSNISVTILEI